MPADSAPSEECCIYAYALLSAKLAKLRVLDRFGRIFPIKTFAHKGFAKIMMKMRKTAAEDSF
jgi:hypothetical protein